MIFSKHRLKSIITKLRKSSFIKNVVVVMTGSAVAQILGFTLTPIISRLFSPSDFGVFGSFGAILSVISAGITLEYTQAMMLPKKNEDAINLLMLSFISVVIISASCLAVFLFDPSFFQGLMKAPNTWIPVMLVVAILFSGLNKSCQSWCVRAKAFKHTAASIVIRSISSKGTQIGLGYLNGGAAGLIVSRILSDMLASVNLAWVLLHDLLTFRRCIRWDRMKQLAKDYRDFPMYSASQNVINALSRGMPVLLIAHFYGIDVAGAYSFAGGILTVPMGFVLTALRQVLFQKASETQHSGERLLPLYMKVTLGMFALAFFPSLFFFIWAPHIFIWIFGSQWHMAGEIARSLILWILVAFCNLPAVLFAKIIRIQRFIFFYDLCLLATRAVTVVLGGLYLSSLNTVMLFALVGAVMNSILIFKVGYAVMKKERHADLERI